MKIPTIRLPDVEAAMLVDVQKVTRPWRGLQPVRLQQIHQEYAKIPAAKAAMR